MLIRSFRIMLFFLSMNVFDNVAYGLKVKKVPKDEIKERVLHMLKLVQLEGFRKKTDHTDVRWSETASCYCQSIDQPS